DNVLGGGLSSRLFRAIREERGLVYDIGSEYHAYRDDGLLVIRGSTAPEHLLQVLGLTFVELGRLATWECPVEEEELWKAKMHLSGQHVLGAENTHTRMSRLATQEFYFGQYLPAGEILAALEAVDGRALRRLAEESLVEALAQASVVVVGPEGPD